MRKINDNLMKNQNIWHEKIKEVEERETFLLPAPGEEIARGRRIARRNLQVLLFFFLPPSLIPLKIGRNNRYLAVAGGLRIGQLADRYIPLGMGSITRYGKP
ncbi:hypothetical protein BHE74_00040565 [Ensete ventricosum]|uniref:Uncharacterized protein n=1 Tax=Ensete ventricosum TaxID=4639 RepID=A0A445MJM5_ENSVE|nr:hypothetical protein BHE74_00040565 [Ensete ventricosum]RZR74426.1 hypothetical protein BHM03_00036838 [Ensete ventricosum]